MDFKLFKLIGFEVGKGNKKYKVSLETLKTIADKNKWITDFQFFIFFYFLCHCIYSCLLLKLFIYVLVVDETNG